MATARFALQQADLTRLVVVLVGVGAVLRLILVSLVPRIASILVEIVVTHLFARIVVLVRKQVNKVRLRVPEKGTLVVHVGHEEGLGQVLAVAAG